VGNADATHTSGKTIVQAPKSLKQIFSKGQHFAAIEKSGQDQGRVPLPLDFIRKLLIIKEVFQSSELCCSRFDALADVSGFNMPYLHEMGFTAFVKSWANKGHKIGTTKEGMDGNRGESSSKVVRRHLEQKTNTFLFQK
jgi:hypothetical protein